MSGQVSRSCEIPHDLVRSQTILNKKLRIGVCRIGQRIDYILIFSMFLILLLAEQSLNQNYLSPKTKFIFSHVAVLRVIYLIKVMSCTYPCCRFTELFDLLILQDYFATIVCPRQSMRCLYQICKLCYWGYVTVRGKYK